MSPYQHRKTIFALLAVLIMFAPAVAISETAAKPSTAVFYVA